MPELIMVLVFGTVMLVAWEVFRPKVEVVGRRINPTLSREMMQERRLEGGPGSRLVAPVARRIGELISKVLPTSMVRGIDHMLIMANQPMSTAAFLSVWAASALFGGFVLFYVLRAFSGLGPLHVLAISAGMLLVFGLGPYIVLRRRVRKRQKRIFRELPYALDLVVTCVEAGLGVDAAIATVTEQSRGPIAETFAHYLKEVGLGRARRSALASAANRTGVNDLIRIAAAVAQAEEMGTTLGDVLRIQAEELRLVRRQRAQEAAQRAPVWMTIPLIFCFLPAMGAVITVPSILNFLSLLGTLRLTPQS